MIALPINLDNSFIAMPHYMVEALGRLQSQGTNTISGSVYIYDVLEQHVVSTSCSVASMLGYTDEAIHRMGIVGLGELIHPDDITPVSEHYQHFSTLRETEVIAIRYRMKRADGEWCWLCSLETPLISTIHGFPLQILGLVQVTPPPTPAQLDALRHHVEFSQN